MENGKDVQDAVKLNLHIINFSQKIVLVKMGFILFVKNVEIQKK